MGSPLPPPSNPLLPDVTSTSLTSAWTEYAQALSNLPGGPEDRLKMLHGLLADVSGRLEEQNRGLISRTLQDYAREQDVPVLRSMPRATRPPTDRPTPESSRQPAPWELLSRSSRLGPRLAQKLVLADVRRSQRR